MAVIMSQTRQANLSRCDRVIWQTQTFSEMLFFLLYLTLEKFCHPREDWEKFSHKLHSTKSRLLLSTIRCLVFTVPKPQTPPCPQTALSLFMSKWQVTLHREKRDTRIASACLACDRVWAPPGMTQSSFSGHCHFLSLLHLILARAFPLFSNTGQFASISSVLGD